MPDPSRTAKAQPSSERSGRRLFTAGSILLLVPGLVHSLPLIKASVPSNDTERPLSGFMSGFMSSYKFDLLGRMRSMQTS